MSELFSSFERRRTTVTIANVVVPIVEPSADDVSFATAEQEQYGARLAVRCVLNENGTRAFSDNDAARLQVEWSAEVLGLITMQIMSFAKRDEHGLGNHLGETQDELSPSVSPLN